MSLSHVTVMSCHKCGHEMNIFNANWDENNRNDYEIKLFHESTLTYSFIPE